MILASAKYVITHQGSDGNEELYIDSFDNLKFTIATTWSKIPHRVLIEGLKVKVLRTDSSREVLESEFTFSSLPSRSLPEHL